MFRRLFFTTQSGEHRYAFVLALQFTMLDLLLRPIGSWHIRPFILALACLGLLSPRFRRMPALYLALLCMGLFRLYYKWPMSDNHDYLLVYWFGAIFLALLTKAPDETLAQSSRWLLAAVFFLAVLWKGFLTTEFVDGTFFRVTFQTDGRFEGLVRSVGGLDANQLEENRAYLTNPLPQGLVPAEAPRYREPAEFQLLVKVFVWATLILEGAIAAAYLLPQSRFIEHGRNILVLSFCIGTYAIAPVAGFGWLILVLGMSQLDKKSNYRYAYAFTFLLLLLYREDSWRELAFSHFLK
jgi:hypothetical protein